jgi:hypothetical protein
MKGLTLNEPNLRHSLAENEPIEGQTLNGAERG